MTGTGRRHTRGHATPVSRPLPVRGTPCSGPSPVALLLGRTVFATMAPGSPSMARCTPISVSRASSPSTDIKLQPSDETADQAQQRLLEINAQIPAHALGLG